MQRQQCRWIHKPVLLKECIKFLYTKKDGIYVDSTIGLGGHAEAILKEIPGAKLIGIDWDEDAINFAKKRLEGFGRNVMLVNENFINIGKILSKFRIEKINGILLDLGLSSLHIENPQRGFSFLKNGPLDMRMSQKLKKKAYDIITNYDENQLARIFREFGEERHAQRIAQAIVRERGQRKLDRTLVLAELISYLTSFQKRLHPATRVFQALRIEVNQELENLKRFLVQFDQFLVPGARIVVISYHSLEDRIVKNIFKEKSTSGNIKILTKKPIRASYEEVRENPRARSAKLRVAEKI